MKKYIHPPNLAAVIAANTILSATPKTFNATPEQLQIVKGVAKSPLRYFTENQFENLEIAGNIFNDQYSSIVIKFFNNPQINLPMQLVSLVALEIAQQISTANGCDDLGEIDVEKPWVKYSNQLIKIAQSLQRAYSTPKFRSKPRNSLIYLAPTK